MTSSLARIPLHYWFVALLPLFLRLRSIVPPENMIEYHLCLKPAAPFERRACQRILGSTSETEAEATKACETLRDDMRELSSGFQSKSNALKEAMLSQGGVDWLITVLTKYAGNTALEYACFEAMAESLYYIERAQYYAADRGLQRLHMNAMARQLDNPDFLRYQTGLVGSFADYCETCGDHTMEAGGVNVFMDIFRKYLNDFHLIENVLNGMTGIVFHSPEGAVRARFYELGFIPFGIEIMAAHPNNTEKQWLNVRQEVLCVVGGLCTHSPKQKEMSDTVMQLYPAEVLKLMRDEPLDPPSNSKSLEFMRTLTFIDKKHGQTFIDMGLLDQAKWAMGNYTTPSGERAHQAGQFWNTHLSGSWFIDSLVQQGFLHEIQKAGFVEVLKMAADNPEGGYQISEYAARGEGACRTLKALSVDYAPCKGHMHTYSAED